MLKSVLRYSLTNRFVIILIALAITAFGWLTLRNLEIDVFPDLTAPSVAVLTESPGMAPEDVERLITFPIETALNGASDVRRVRSSTVMGFSIVWIDFDWGMDIYKARQIVSEKLVLIQESLPGNSHVPFMAPQSSIMGEIILIAVHSESTDPMELRTLVDWEITPRLLAIDGVSQVVTIGGDLKEYQIQLDPLKMAHYKINLNEVMSVCQDMNENTSGGIINQHGLEYIIRGMAQTNQLESIAGILVKKHNGIPVLLGQIADVKIGNHSPKVGESYYNGKKSVVMTVLKQPSGNSIEITERIALAIEELRSSLPQGVIVDDHVFRQSDFVRTSVNNVARALIEGGIFVTLILFLFLMNVRTTVISLIAIPISLLITIIVIRLFGYSINTMSLGGMAIAIGVLVDDAIIDVEIVLKRLKENRLLPDEERQPIIKVVYQASLEIRSSIIHATVIIIVAFLPLFFLSGMEGRMLRPLGITFIVSLLASMFVALTLTPVLCSFAFTTEKQLSRPVEGGNALVRSLNRAYVKVLDRLLSYKKWLIGIPVLLLIGTIIVLTSFGSTFLPRFNEGVLTITSLSVPGISLEETNLLNQQLGNKLMEMDGVKLVTRRTGRAEKSEHAHGGSNSSEIDVPFDLKGRTLEEFMEEVRHELSSIGGLSFVIGQPLSHRIDHMLSGTRAEIAVKIFGKELGTLYNLGSQVGEIAETIPGLVDVNIEQQIDVPQIQITPNRTMLAHYGIPLHEFNEFVRVAFGGEKVGEVYEGNRRFDLMVRLKDEQRDGIEQIQNAYIDSDSGKKVPLKLVANIVSAGGPVSINREDVQRKLVVSANVSGTDLNTAVTELQDAVSEQLSLPQEYFIEYGGQFESAATATRRILWASILAFVVILMILVYPLMFFYPSFYYLM
ncbi:MAG: efflux RND transporter permease subunit [Bacteroidetes bacterium]|nr:efflux RND transporter permease subunit [Bacteroidota bacterium]